MFGKASPKDTLRIGSEEWVSGNKKKVTVTLEEEPSSVKAPISPTLKDNSYATLLNGPLTTSKHEAKTAPKPSTAGISKMRRINPSTMNKAELLAEIVANTKQEFSNFIEYRQAQLKLFLYAVSKNATLDDLITAGMRDREEKAVENKPYQSTDSDFKTIMHLLIADVNEPELRRNHAEKIRAMHIAWEAAKTEPKPPRIKASTARQFHFPKEAPKKPDVSDAQLMDFFSNPLAR